MSKIVGENRFSSEMERLEVTTPAHAEQWNRRHQQLLDNDTYLKNQLGKKQDCFDAIIDLSGSEYDQYTWYPVTGTPIPKGGLHKIRAYTTFDLGAHPSWATNEAGYTCNMEVYDKSQEWGQTDGSTLCTNYSWKHTNQIPCGYLQMANSSIPVLTLRGGGIYYVETDYESDWTVRTGAYTYRDNTVRPENAARFEFNRTTIFANLDGNVNEAYVNFQENSSYEIASGDKVYTLFGKLKKFVNTVKSKAPNLLSSGRVPLTDKLYTKRYIDGVGFDGSANASHCGLCSTPGSTAAKTVSLSNFSLVTGARAEVLFSNTNTAINPTLNVNSTGAKPIYYRGAAIPTGYIQANQILNLVYYGGYWQVVGDLTQMQVVTIYSIDFARDMDKFIAKVPYPDGFDYNNTRVLGYTILTSQNALSGSFHYVVSSKEMTVEAWENELRLIWEGATDNILNANVTIWHQ